MRLPSLLAILGLSIVSASPLRDYDVHNSLVERAANQKCVPIDFSFKVKVPYKDGVEEAPVITYNGFHWKLPKQAASGELISFFGNFFGNQTLASQINTVSSSTQDPNGPSSSNATAMANSTTVVAITFSSGNASSAAGAAQNSTTITSTSSTGAANSTANATSNALGVVTINTNATVANATDAQSLQNERAAAAATSCAADNEGASASAKEITTVSFQTGQGENVTSVAYAACAAGLVAPCNATDAGSSASGSQASITSVSAGVVCDGVSVMNTKNATILRISVDGTYCKKTGFSGAIVGQRVARTKAMC